MRNFSGNKKMAKFLILVTFEVANIRNKFRISATSCLYQVFEKRTD